jgi:hypothetical protein
MQNPVVQGTPLQQSAVTVQAWPYSAQGGGGGGPASITTGFLQIPLVDPGVIWHGIPAQQSAVVVQVPPSGTQALPQIKGGVPLGLGTHGRLQQSALDAHALPT